jgi:putative transcriptional regulator
MPRTPKRSVGERMLKGIAEFSAALDSGDDLHKRFTIRTTRSLAAPKSFAPEDIIALRHVIGASQAKFAEVVGASVITVQSWEQGHRKPTPMACRLLEEINRNRKYWQSRLSGELVSAK